MDNRVIDNRIIDDRASKGLIVIGYQGIGKTTYSHSYNNAIDLQSSLFNIDGYRDPDWYIVYCRIAISLAEQGYIVFTSSHKKVVNELKRYKNNTTFSIVIISPNTTLEKDWIKKLRKRWEEDIYNIEKETAYRDAEENFQKETKWLSRQNDLAYVPLTTIDYSLDDTIKGICKIYKITSQRHFYNS